MFFKWGEGRNLGAAGTSGWLRSVQRWIPKQTRSRPVQWGRPEADGRGGSGRMVPAAKECGSSVGSPGRWVKGGSAAAARPSVPQRACPSVQLSPLHMSCWPSAPVRPWLPLKMPEAGKEAPVCCQKPTRPALLLRPPSPARGKPDLGKKAGPVSPSGHPEGREGTAFSSRGCRRRGPFFGWQNPPLELPCSLPVGARDPQGHSCFFAGPGEMGKREEERLQPEIPDFRFGVKCEHLQSIFI